MKNFIVLLFLGFILQVNAQTGSEIYLADLDITDAGITLSNPKNITNHKGYDNQPFFHPDKHLLYYSSFNDEERSDIKVFNYKNNKTELFTQTKERLNIGTETFFCTPWKLLGVHFTPFGFIDNTFLQGGHTLGIQHYAVLGGGVLVSGQLFNLFQLTLRLGVGYCTKKLTPKSSPIAWVLEEGSSTGSPSLIIAAPRTLKFD